LDWIRYDEYNATVCVGVRRYRCGRNLTVAHCIRACARYPYARAQYSNGSLHAGTVTSDAAAAQLARPLFVAVQFDASQVHRPQRPWVPRPWKRRRRRQMEMAGVGRRLLACLRLAWAWTGLRTTYCSYDWSYWFLAGRGEDDRSTAACMHGGGVSEFSGLDPVPFWPSRCSARLAWACLHATATVHRCLGRRPICLSPLPFR
jgi:hypothetical protein